MAPKASEKKVAYNRDFNERAYDRVNLLIPKGRLQPIKDYAKSQGTSVNSMVNEYFRKELGMTEEQWKERKPEKTEDDKG